MDFLFSRFVSPKKSARILVRVDFNVPIVKGKIQDDLRIKKMMPVIRRYRRGARYVILISHLEDEKGNTPTLAPVAAYLKRNGLPVRFIPHLPGEMAVKEIKKLKKGEIALLENLRKDPREKKNDTSFARGLAALGDIFINDAFSASHRKHASIVGVPRFLKSVAGDAFREEVLHLSRAFRPPHPFMLVVGGRKPIKIDLAYAFLKKADSIIVGGAIANTLLLAKGVEVGKSVVESASLHVLRALIFSKKIMLPRDVVVERGGKKITVPVDRVEKNDSIYDIGPETQKIVQKKVLESSFILWNGPLGYAEKGFKEGTFAFLRALFEKRAKREVITGGGDTIAFLHNTKYLSRFNFVSMGGGAMLEFLAEGTLPGIEALRKK